MWMMFDVLASNLGVTFGTLVVVVFTIGSFIFMAKDFTIGIFIFILTQAGVFIWFYEAGINYAIPLTLFFIGLVILSLNLYSHFQQARVGGII